ncbi:DUF2252 domain-containing protein [Amycolatopsis regifaucium]|uniref:DUF2252 domain-containing protein n=1 Tax=Amycolatopsis regifaucium TaxID=546365 RepID=A0A154M885_9PSEU|nr:DUF2252 domain-containing protein [Amycolatopsis regifaucium]KZB80643.1 hypothetical protein AVL48_11755 [Amycolatopsis regifaucium]OKA03076.1 hypothetical protein ATP06_0238075 [Amycolatopsis regifaucium]SFH01568.1 Uncharacterized conserved protein, DUF2252 family [Amycolatopsis regifaucium]
MGDEREWVERPLVGTETVSPEDWSARGKALRDKAPTSAHDHSAAGADRPTVAEFFARSNEGRLPELVELRRERMLASPFTFYRGAAGLMAADLAGTPASGLTAQLCGDAHAANFGLYGTPEGQIVMDINDFDESVPGPWEWDLKRLAASLVLAGREGGIGESGCREAAEDAVKSYRRTIRGLAALPFLRSWNALPDASVLSAVKAHDLIDDFEEAAEKARKNTSAKVTAKWTRRIDDHRTGLERHRFVEDPPVLTHVDDATAEAVLTGLVSYVDTLRESRRTLISRYRVSDVAFRVVGTGSVGLRSYVALLHGNSGEDLVLQVKQANPSALSPYLGLASPDHEGRRIVEGARLVQAETDILLGWTTIDGLPYIVRQFRNLKGDIDPAELKKDHLDDYGRLAGALLARAHARSLHPRLLAGYFEDDEDLDEAIGAYAVRYADQTEADFAAFAAL